MEGGESTFLHACTLDHDGCVVCSDAGIPLRIVMLEGDDARCVDAVGNETVIAVELVQPVEVGEVILTHGGVAIGKSPLTPSPSPMLGEERESELRMSPPPPCEGEGAREVRG